MLMKNKKHYDFYYDCLLIFFVILHTILLKKLSNFDTIFHLIQFK